MSEQVYGFGKSEVRRISRSVSTTEQISPNPLVRGPNRFIKAEMYARLTEEILDEAEEPTGLWKGVQQYFNVAGGAMADLSTGFQFDEDYPIHLLPGVTGEVDDVIKVEAFGSSEGTVWIGLKSSSGGSAGPQRLIFNASGSIGKNVIVTGSDADLVDDGGNILAGSVDIFQNKFTTCQVYANEPIYADKKSNPAGGDYYDISPYIQGIGGSSA